MSVDVLRILRKREKESHWEDWIWKIRREGWHNAPTFSPTWIQHWIWETRFYRPLALSQRSLGDSLGFSTDGSNVDADSESDLEFFSDSGQFWLNYYYELLLWIIRGFDTVSWHWIWFIQSRPFLAIFGDAMPKERKRGNQRKLGQRRLNRFCRDVNKPMIVTTWSMTLTLVY